ncbi:DUF6458 family protein [Nocardioides bruguierae]|uniref:DUF6458 family protein n=1 Tax=Nocardioides bruguierae TaxID=2945102 RepID=A0A9X2DA92_9ACTN|nr:DUF6458 family protein [Nocardioides bruguierae]MCL8027090.1 DUF6458 family protein [Nocardioides bruguierae]MCM0622228.1 DUF6458 family protein [Nocardioides bruguierae]
MGYGLGALLVAVGLILALAVQDSISGVDTTMIGWILTVVGLVVLGLTAFTLNKSRGTATTATTTHADGTQTTTERATTTDV